MGSEVLGEELPKDTGVVLDRYLSQKLQRRRWSIRVPPNCACFDSV